MFLPIVDSYMPRDHKSFLEVLLHWFLILENSVNDRGSAVRLFTNATPSLFTFPEKEGYKYCDMCERWVYNENKHCFKCEACTSKVFMKIFLLCDSSFRRLSKYVNLMYLCLSLVAVFYFHFQNGGLYKHCNLCGKCVKQTWKHCKKCGICKLAGHVCNEDSSNIPRQVNSMIISINHL